MKICKSPFFVWFTGRTGSTFLCDLLHSHPQIFCRKEQFCEVKIGQVQDFPAEARTFEDVAGTFGRRLFTDDKIIDDPTDEQTMEYLDSIYQRTEIACGFKLKFPMQSLVYPELVERLKKIPDLKLIELVRENALKQAISLQNVNRIKHLEASRSCNITESVKLEPLHLDVAQTIQDANFFLRSRERFREFSSMFANVLPIHYEELLDNQERTLIRILDFLEVDTDFDLNSQFKKTTPDKLSEAVRNYDELKAAVAGTGLAAFLD